MNINIGHDTKAAPARSGAAGKSVLLLGAVALFLAAAEIYFRFFFVESDGFGITLAHHKWFRKYWHPVNALGYRDAEWTPQNLKGKKTVAVVGDSFAAGHGVNADSERFGNVLGKRLGKEWAVVTIAQCGWNTRGELSALQHYPHRLDCVILSYFPNDIGGAARAAGNNPPHAFLQPGQPLLWLISRSHFLNFAYYRLRRLGIYRGADEDIRWLRNQYNDPKAWEAHRAELENFQHAVQAREAKLIVLFFPFLTRREDSRFAYDKVAPVFEAAGVPILNVADLLHELDEKDYTVNRVDRHPSPKLHAMVGKILYEKYFHTLPSSAK